MVMSGSGLLLGPTFGFMTLMHPCSVLMFMALDTIEDQEDRAVQSWPLPLTDSNLRENRSCPLPVEALRKEGPLPRQHNRADPIDRGADEPVPECECGASSFLAEMSRG